MSFNPATLLPVLTSLPGLRRFRVALSGGLDSTVLLHALRCLRDASALPVEFDAIHVNHGISPRAASWQLFCQDICAQAQVPLTISTLELDRSTAGLERRARDARYESFAELLSPGDCLLLAHHQDDQLETFLLRLLRGAGPRGLSGMPVQRPLGSGILCRPMLGFPRAMLQEYAHVENLDWVEDESNADQQFDRNFIRHSLIPLLITRWPQLHGRVSKSRALCEESYHLASQLAEHDLELLQSPTPGVLHLPPMLGWKRERQRNVLRHWLRCLEIPEPGWNLLHRLVDEVLNCRVDGPGQLDLGSCRVQRWRDYLYALDLSGNWQQRVPTWFADGTMQIELPGNGRLEIDWQGLQDVMPVIGGFTVGYRQGGEVCRLPHRPTKSLKKLLQESAVEPWLRDRYPLLMAKGKLALIPDLGVNQDGAWAMLDPQPRCRWLRPELICPLVRKS